VVQVDFSGVVAGTRYRGDFEERLKGLIDEIRAHSEELVVFIDELHTVVGAGGGGAEGRTVDFTNTVIVMTSNLGSEAVGGRGSTLGFGAPGAENAEEARRERVLRPLREHFRPEFLNRIDEIVVFRRLTDEQLRRVTDLLLDETRRRLRARDVGIEVSDAAVEWMVERGFQPEYGARPLRRTIQRELDNRLSRMVLGGELREHSRVVVDVADGELVVRTEAGAEAVTP
jgi:ATP-dependent Clp protease ATP-binding subunit ClpC